MTNARGGRQSKAEREQRAIVLIRDDDSGIIARPKPLAELTPEEADEWIAICNAVPATYFPPSTYMLLTSYCRHVVLARHLWQMIRQVESGPKKKFDLHRYTTLLKQHRAEEAAVAATLRTMRLTHLSTYAHDRTPLPEAAPKPWLS